jgi:hypothetical protein
MRWPQTTGGVFLNQEPGRFEQNTGWFPVEIASVLGGGGYTFTEVEIAPDGTTRDKQAGRRNQSTDPAYALFGDTFEVGDGALCRSGRGAGGRVWELTADPSSATAADCRAKLSGLRNTECVTFSVRPYGDTTWTDAVSIAGAWETSGWAADSTIVTGDGDTLLTLFRKTEGGLGIRATGETATWYGEAAGPCGEFAVPYCPPGVGDGYGVGSSSGACDELTPCADHTFRVRVTCHSCTVAPCPEWDVARSLCVTATDFQWSWTGSGGDITVSGSGTIDYRSDIPAFSQCGWGFVIGPGETIDTDYWWYGSFNATVTASTIGLVPVDTVLPMKVIVYFEASQCSPQLLLTINGSRFGAGDIGVAPDLVPVSLAVDTDLVGIDWGFGSGCPLGITGLGGTLAITEAADCSGSSPPPPPPPAPGTCCTDTGEVFEAFNTNVNMSGGGMASFVLGDFGSAWWGQDTDFAYLWRFFCDAGTWKLETSSAGPLATGTALTTDCTTGVWTFDATTFGLTGTITVSV